MFKGLRTKIESEQKGQTNESLTRNATTNTNLLQKNSSDIGRSSVTSVGPTCTNPNVEEKVSTVPVNDTKTSLDLNDGQKNEFDQKDDSKHLNTFEELHKEISRLNHQLNTVINEKNERDEQNAQLQQTVDKLKRDFENEKQASSSLTIKLSESQSTLKEKLDLIEDLKNRPLPSNISMKPYNPVNEYIRTDAKSPESVEAMALRLNDLQNQLSEKSRQLKIRQQNLLDIKKALQKEISDHIKTQDELCKLQNQLKQHAQEQNDKLEDANLQNGSSEMELTAHEMSNSSHNDISVKHMGHFEVAADEVKPSSGLVSTQMDVISTHSRSTASVDDFESNDLQSSCNNREVNLEYLRNVLFRYMTTTDSETAQHLIKALTVIMNFTPEQAAAIKSAMNTRSLSWLRLK